MGAASHPTGRLRLAKPRNQRQQVAAASGTGEPESISLLLATADSQTPGVSDTNIVAAKPTALRGILCSQLPTHANETEP